MSNDRIAVVTGGNKGIGLGICRGLAAEGVRVILTARDEARGKAACDALRKEGHNASFHLLDVAEPKSIDTLAAYVEGEFGRLDILVNNAAIRIDRGESAESVSLDVFRKMMETNTYAPLRLCQAFVPLLKKSRSGRIVNMSSGMASLANMAGGSPAYRITKTALNAVTKILASELKGSGILVNAAHPGHVLTDMGGPSAKRTVEQGADTPVWLALLDEGGPTGGFFMDRKPIPW